MSDTCPRCRRAVFFAEEVRMLGKKWHKLCLKCAFCNKLMDSTTCTDHDEEIYCQNCYKKQFGPKGYGFSGGAGCGLSMDTGKLNEVPHQNVSHLAKAHTAPLHSSNGKSSFKYGTADLCPRCGTKVYMAEKVVGAGQAYHKCCFKCLECRKSLDSTTLCDKNGEIYCKSCYNKSFGPSGFGFGVNHQRTV